MYSWADPGFQVRGGAIKKNCTERREARNFIWVFRVKNHDFMPKNLIFSHFKGGVRRVHPPPPLDPHLVLYVYCYTTADILWSYCYGVVVIICRQNGFCVIT